eukprot:COSAG01_NODE_3621_length_5860_cov_4.719840_1_plen_31_part_00
MSAYRLTANIVHTYMRSNQWQDVFAIAEQS